MTMTFPGHSAPAVGFEVPLEMLAACHLRVQDQCATLLRLVPHIAAHGPDRPAQEAATAVMRYFDTSARHHHDDEERDLFPALLESMAGSDAVCLREITAALTTDHRELEARWKALRAVLAQVAAGQAAPLAQDEVSGFTDLYARHIAREESELLPMAQRLLSDAELDRIGLAMRLRRAPPGDPMSKRSTS
jgi:hemerythrin-like domain-containing protein